MREEVDDDVGSGTWNGAACVGVRGELLMRRLPLDQVSVVPNGVRFTDVLAVHVQCEEFCGQLLGGGVR